MGVEAMKLVTTERTVRVLSEAVGDEPLSHVMVSEPYMAPAGHYFTILTPTLILQSTQPEHADDDPVVSMFPRRNILRLQFLDHYADESSDGPDSYSASSAVIATYLGGGQVTFETGPTSALSHQGLVDELRADLMGQPAR